MPGGSQTPLPLVSHYHILFFWPLVETHGPEACGLSPAMSALKLPFALWLWQCHTDELTHGKTLLSWGIQLPADWRGAVMCSHCFLGAWSLLKRFGLWVVSQELSECQRGWPGIHPSFCTTVMPVAQLMLCRAFSKQKPIAPSSNRACLVLTK